jgi:dynein heavy chain, axonemal
VIRGSLQTLLKTLEGKFVTTAEIESLKASILNNSIPEKWRNVSYQSRKPLLAYVNDLQSRLRMLDNWIQHGKPNVFWISGFFFTQSFLTGVKQNFARKFKHPIDQVDFTFRVLKFDESD